MAKPRSFVISVVLLFTFLPIASMGLIARVSAAPPAISLTNPLNISDSPTKAVYADVAVDANGHIHVAWLEYSADNTISRVLYTNNINGSFFPAYEVAGGGGTNAEHILAIAVETNRVHVFYTANDKTMRHRLVKLEAGNPTRDAITTLTPGSSKGYAPTATVDSAGRVHAAWIDNRSGTYQIYHRIWTNGGWEAGDRAIRANGSLQDRPSLAATSDGRVHILYVSGPSPQYAFFDGSNWQQANAPGGGGKSANSAALTSDGTNLYAVWSITNNNNVHVVNFNQGVNGNWGTTRAISRDGEFSDNPTAFFNKANGKVYAAWTSGDSREIALREIDPNGAMSDVVNIGRGPSNWPMGDGGTAGVAIVWQDKSSGQEEVIVRSATGSAKPRGSIAINSEFTPLLGGAGVAGSFDATVTNTGGRATSVTLTPDGAEKITQNFSDPSTTITNISFSPPVKLCEQRTIRGTLTGPGGTSDEFSATAWIDRDVDATATLVNENGDPNYTNASEVQVRIASGVDECSGLATYTVDFGKTPDNQDPAPYPSQSFAIPTGATVNIPMPDGTDGKYPFVVTVRDRAGFSRSYDFTVTKDTTNPDASLASGETIPATVEEGSFVRLDLSQLRVQDNYVNPLNNAVHYWGIRMISLPSTAPAPSATDEVWASRGVVVPGIAPDSLRWNVLLGLVGEFKSNTSYTIYLQALDGAGNASKEVLATNSVLISGRSGQVFLPTIMR